MNEELCALQLVRIKTIKDKWEFNIHNLNKSNSWQFKYQLFTSFKVNCIVYCQLFIPSKIEKKAELDHHTLNFFFVLFF